MAIYQLFLTISPVPKEYLKTAIDSDSFSSISFSDFWDVDRFNIPQILNEFKKAIKFTENFNHGSFHSYKEFNDENDNDLWIKLKEFQIYR